MKTLKLQVQGADHPSILEDRRTQSSCTRSSYKDREKRHLTQNESYNRCRGLFDLNSHLVTSAVRRATWIRSAVKENRKQIAESKEVRKDKDEKKAEKLEAEARKEGRKVNGMGIIHRRRDKARKKVLKKRKDESTDMRRPAGARKGRKKSFQPRFGKYEQRSRGLATREGFKRSRLIALLMEGEAGRHGNRHFEINAEKGTITYKRFLEIRTVVPLADGLSDNNRCELKELQAVLESGEKVAVFLDAEKMELTFKRRDGKITTVAVAEGLRKGRLRKLKELQEAIEGGAEIECVIDVENMTVSCNRDVSERVKLKIADNISKNQLRELKRLEEAMKNKELPVTLSIGDGFVSLSFDDAKLYKAKREEVRELSKPDRVMALDLNPNFIGVAVVERLGGEDFNVLDKFVYDLTVLTANHNADKRRHELIELNYRLMRLAGHFRVGTVVVEDLDMPSCDLGRGKDHNRLCNNDWNRNTTAKNLATLCIRHGLNFVKVDPCYSSFIGNIRYGDETTPDMVAAAMELALRAPTENFPGRVKPAYNVSMAEVERLAMRRDIRWKELDWSNIRGWWDLYNKTKDPELMYRVSLESTTPRGQRFYRKMLVTKHDYM